MLGPLVITNKGSPPPTHCPWKWGKDVRKRTDAFFVVVGGRVLHAPGLQPPWDSLSDSHACFSWSQFPSHNMGCGDPPPPEVQQGRKSPRGRPVKDHRCFTSATARFCAPRLLYIRWGAACGVLRTPFNLPKAHLQSPFFVSYCLSCLQKWSVCVCVTYVTICHEHVSMVWLADGLLCSVS